MNYIQTVTLNYPVTLAEIRAEFPNTSFPDNPVDETLEDFNYANVVEIPMPTWDDETQRVREDSPQDLTTHWEQVWETIQRGPANMATRLQDYKRNANQGVLNDADDRILAENDDEGRRDRTTRQNERNDSIAAEVPLDQEQKDAAEVDRQFSRWTNQTYRTARQSRRDINDSSVDSWAAVDAIVAAILWPEWVPPT